MFRLTATRTEDGLTVTVTTRKGTEARLALAAGGSVEIQVTA